MQLKTPQQAVGSTLSSSRSSTSSSSSHRHWQPEPSWATPLQSPAVEHNLHRAQIPWVHLLLPRQTWRQGWRTSCDICMLTQVWLLSPCIPQPACISSRCCWHCSGGQVMLLRGTRRCGLYTQLHWCCSCSYCITFHCINTVNVAVSGRCSVVAPVSVCAK